MSLTLLTYPERFNDADVTEMPTERAEVGMHLSAKILVRQGGKKLQRVGSRLFQCARVVCWCPHVVSPHEVNTGALCVRKSSVNAMMEFSGTALHCICGDNRSDATTVALGNRAEFWW